MLPLRELEVFVGFIVNRSGRQTPRQRDQSAKLRDEFERISANIVRQMRRPFDAAAGAIDESVDGSVAGEPPVQHNKLDGLEMAMACMEVGCMQDFGQAHSGRNADYVSFRILAAATVLKELKLLARTSAAETQGGGYVGLSQGVSGNAAAWLQIPRALVPDQVQAARAEAAMRLVVNGVKGV